MKFIFRLIVSAILVCGSCLLASCGSRHAKESGVKVCVDSLFIDLSKADREGRSAMADKVFTKMRQELGLNGVVLYAEGGRVLYEKAFGWRNLTRCRDSIRMDDQFQIASVSKMFTAEAVVLLHSRGKLNYDDDVKRYLPEFPYEGVTLRHLLNHRSGLSRYETLADEHWPDRSVPIDNEAVIKLYAKHRPEPYNTPGVTFHYTNVNYVLLASIIERISGQRFEDFMKEEVFEPLGMDHSFIYSLRGVDRLDLYVNTPMQGHDYFREGPKRVQEDYLNGVVGDKGMYSTVEDLFRFSVALECGLLVPDSLQKEVFVPGSDEWKNGDNYGFGWRLSKRHPGAVYHFGWWKGYRSFFIINRELERVLIILTNANSSAPGDPAWEFMEDTTLSLPPACALP